ncbi:hypothetical protein [Variovorax paradoxus]|uniref:hypothetical protein n=1 Tax=Variovorax paradoxus TaxID=34073 RepID=UPI0024807CE1|nr:hypothetical protein [Variovorax paradoxus]WGT65757.1 hypothetical protein QHG62_10575 [Variovorax paradoxus]
MYTWMQLGAREMTALYLYGQTTPPQNLASAAMIRPAGPITIDMDAVSFMAGGPGRFANASSIQVVKGAMRQAASAIVTNKTAQTQRGIRVIACLSEPIEYSQGSR